jgi:hypothetical protein
MCVFRVVPARGTLRGTPAQRSQARRPTRRLQQRAGTSSFSSVHLRFNKHPPLGVNATSARRWTSRTWITFQQAPTLGGECYANLEDREITIIPPRPTASSPQPPPHAAKPHPHNNDAASNHPSHDATPFPSSSNEDYNTVNHAHATHTPTNAPNTHESPANDETTHYPNTPPSAHPDALPPALTHPNTAPQPPSDTNPTPPQTLSDAPRPLASPNDLSHSHDPHAHPRGHTAHRAHRRPTLRQRQPYPKAACVQKHHPTRPRN